MNKATVFGFLATTRSSQHALRIVGRAGARCCSPDRFSGLLSIYQRTLLRALSCAHSPAAPHGNRTSRHD